MFSRGYPSQSPRFSPNRRGSNGNQPSPYNNNNISPANCGYQQRHPGNYRTPSPRGQMSYNSPSPSPQFQVPRSPRFLGPAIPFPNPFGPGPSNYGSPAVQNRAYPNHRSPRSYSPRHNSFPYNSSPRGRGNFPHGKTSTPKFRGRQGMWAKKNQGDSNPGGSSNIKLYYNHSMTEDPWRKLTPLPFTHVPAATT